MSFAWWVDLVLVVLYVFLIVWTLRIRSRIIQRQAVIEDLGEKIGQAQIILAELQVENTRLQRAYAQAKTAGLS